MQVVEELEQVPTTYLKKLVNTKDIWEIRVQMGSNIFRFLGFFNQGSFIVLTNGFQKKHKRHLDLKFFSQNNGNKII